MPAFLIPFKRGMFKGLASQCTLPVTDYTTCLENEIVGTGAWKSTHSCQCLN